MATEAQQVRAYVHHTRYTTQHVLRVFFEDLLDTDAPTFASHLEVLRHKLCQLKQLQIHAYEYRMTITWWGPQSTYRPRHLNPHEAHELVAMNVAEVLASLCSWAKPPHIVHVGELVELLDIERAKNIDWGIGGKST